MNTDSITCEICDEPIEYCTCWRCSECEQLFAAPADSTSDCPHCAGDPL